MFWGRTKELRTTAKSLAEFLLKINTRATSMRFDEFVDYCRKQKFQEAHYRKSRLGGSFEYSFSNLEGPVEDSEFIFSVISSEQEEERQRQLDVMATGYDRFSGIQIFGGILPYHVALRDGPALEIASLGRDARHLYSELLTFPGFRKYGDWSF